MKKYLLFTLFLSTIPFFSQSDFNTGFLPKVMISKKLTERTKWVNSIETRSVIYDERYQFSHNLVDISSIYSLKTTTNQSFNFGYILRFRGSETIHRTFQHYNFVGRFLTSKIGHRIAFEQFYQTKKHTTFRTRYRVSLEKPLNGERVNVNEFYIKLGNEYLYDFEGNNLEVRLSPYLGYQASKKDRIELGIDYRVNRVHTFISTITENQFWFRATWYISL